MNLEKLKARINALTPTPQVLTVTAYQGEDLVEVSDPETNFFQKVTRKVARALESQHKGLTNWIEIKIRPKVD